MKYYAVKNGRVPGIYTTWKDCKAQVDGYSSAVYKSFTAKRDALAYIGAAASTNSPAPSENTSKSPETDAVPSTEAWAYVDGSYLHSRRRYSYGMVICDDDGEHEFYEAFENAEMASMRNVAGEIEGSMHAIKYCLERKIKSLTIFYDYEGIERWANGEWKTNKDGTKKYAQTVKNARKSMEIIFVKVKGHSGDKYNDRADLLAKKALGI